MKYMISDKCRIQDLSVIMCITYYNEDMCFSNNELSKDKINYIKTIQTFLTNI